MKFVITDICLKCAMCATYCPVLAIEEQKDQYQINSDKCIRCGKCKRDCPVEAIIAEK